MQNITEVWINRIQFFKYMTESQDRLVLGLTENSKILKSLASVILHKLHRWLTCVDIFRKCCFARFLQSMTKNIT